ncbi:MAG: four-carbon acid sugar kinase family protein, partial [Acetobacteraceae bacterium]
MTSRPLVAFYGDDLTGSADTLSVLAEAGLTARLYLNPPTEQEREAAGALDAMGIAGTSRMMSPAEMDQHLPVAFAALKASRARLVHYKVCSTFDSSPALGSIGHAMRLARSQFRADFVPIVVGQPGIGRYCAFGSLFASASAGGPVYRLDRHPNMARHPTTPMDEADLRLILGRQGVGAVALFEITSLRSPTAPRALARLLDAKPDAVLFDVIEENDLSRIGRLIGGRLPAAEPIFGVGSSALQQALLAGWPLLAGRAASLRSGPAPRPEPVFVVSGSRSPVTAAQIKTAEGAGFAALSLDPVRLADPEQAIRAIAESARAAALQLAAGQSVIAHTSLGPDDPRALAGDDRGSIELLAKAAGRLVDAVLELAPVRRLGFCGGDTASLAVRILGVHGLTYAYRLAAGVPVCRVHHPNPRLDGLLIMLKG